MLNTLGINLQKDSPQSLHEQLVTQLSFQIASGKLSAHTKLPSVRALASRLGVHYNTVLEAYKQLSLIGLLESRQGSGYRVAPLPADTQLEALGRHALQLDQMASTFVQLAQQKGYSKDTVTVALNKAWNQSPLATSPSCVFVDAHPDIIPLFEAELSQVLERPIPGVSFDELPRVPDNAVFLVSRYHVQTLLERLPNATIGKNVWVFDVNTHQSDMNRIKQLPDGAMVLIISESTIVHQTAEALLIGVRGDTLFRRAFTTRQLQTHEAKSLLSSADLIFADRLAYDYVAIELNHRPHRLALLQLINPAEGERLKQLLSPAYATTSESA